MTMTPLQKLSTVLTVVFAVTVVALVVQLLYIVWRRRKFQQHGLRGGGDPESNAPGDDSFPAPTKELLYLLCWRSQSRVEPDGASETRPVPEPGELDELAKWQRLCGPPRLLFTIKEEEREDFDADVDSDGNSAANLASKRSDRPSYPEKHKAKRVCLRECLAEVDDDPAPEERSTGEETVLEETPFSTPCGSPPYFTPTPSPVRGPVEAATVNIVA